MEGPVHPRSVLERHISDQSEPAMSDLVQLTKDDLVQLTKDKDVAIISINNPPVNAIGPAVSEGISQAIKEITQDESVKAAVIIGAGRTFVAGADIREFGRITSGQTARGA